MWTHVVVDSSPVSVVLESNEILSKLAQIKPFQSYSVMLDNWIESETSRKKLDISTIYKDCVPRYDPRDSSNKQPLLRSNQLLVDLRSSQLT